jgi:hypothetical protein
VQYGLGPAAEKTDEWNYLLVDGTTTPRQLVDLQGEVTLSTRYDPWGDTLELEGTGNFSFGYLNSLLDLTTGLLYVGNGQYYDPATGRFLTRGVNPNNTNPYVPWNLSPTGAIIGPLALLAMFYRRKKGVRGKADPYLLVLCAAFILLGVGMACRLGGGSPAPANPSPTPTMPPASTQEPAGAGTAPAVTPSPSSSPTQQPAEPDPCANCTSTPTPTPLPKLKIFFGGSWGQDRITERGPNPAEQTPVWNETADVVIQYPGSKTEHAKMVNIDDYANTNLIVIGYSAGADSALIFAYAYWQEQQKQGFLGRITDIAVLGGTMTGNLIDGGNLATEWPHILNTLLGWGTDIYVLNDIDQAGTGGEASGYSAPSGATGEFWYDDQSDPSTGQEHWQGPWGGPISYSSTGTNNSPAFRDKVMSWFDNH